MRAARLRRGEDIARVRSQGVSRNGTLFSLRALATDGRAVRVAVAASRAVGGAVPRNRARRRVREALRLALLPRSPRSGADLVLLARPGALRASAAELRESIDRELDAILSPGPGSGSGHRP